MKWVRRIAYAVATLCSLAAIALLVMAMLAPSASETWGWAIWGYIFVACAGLLFSQASHLE